MHTRARVCVCVCNKVHNALDPSVFLRKRIVSSIYDLCLFPIQSLFNAVLQTNYSWSKLFTSVASPIYSSRSVHTYHTIILLFLNQPWTDTIFHSQCHLKVMKKISSLDFSFLKSLMASNSYLYLSNFHKLLPSF